MKINQIAELLDNKIKNLQDRLETARITGDIENSMLVENELEETKLSLQQLNTLH